MIERLRSDVLDVELVPSVGGRCHRVRAFGRDLLRMSPDLAALHDDPFFSGWYSLVPWSNRIPDGKLVFDGRTYDLPANYTDGSALHGHAYAAPWEPEAVGRYHFYHAAGAFPWAYSASQEWSVEGDALVQSLAVRNESDGPMPAGLGIHPWWAAEGGLEVSVPCRAAYHCEGGLAVGAPFPIAEPPSGPVPWGTDQLFTDLAKQETVLRWPEWGIEATLSFSDTAPHVQLAAFARVNAVAVEPVTHASDGHRRLAAREPGAIDVLAPGDSLAVVYRLAVRRLG